MATKRTKRATTRRGWGAIRKLPSGRYQASYTGPDLVRYPAPITFDTQAAAEEWLALERRTVTSGDWIPPAERRAELERIRKIERATKPPTLAEYSTRWLAARKTKGRPLADRTRDHYADLLDRIILPTLGTLELREITPEHVADWYDAAALDRPTTRAHAYSLLRSILATAADPAANSGKPRIPFNPCGIRGGGTSPRGTRAELATAEEVATIAAAMPPAHRLLVLLADGIGLRFGELAELRRSDLDLKNGMVRVRRAVARSRSVGPVVKGTKSEAGARDIPLPPHLIPEVRKHLLEHTEPGRTGRLFPGTHGGYLAPSTFYGHAATFDKDGNQLTAGYGWYEARRAAGRDDLRLHDLRHGALTEAARLGATLAELMALGGHSTSTAALRYQRSSSDRLTELARLRSEAQGWTAEGAQ